MEFMKELTRVHMHCYNLTVLISAVLLRLHTHYCQHLQESHYDGDSLNGFVCIIKNNHWNVRFRFAQNLSNTF